MGQVFYDFGNGLVEGKGHQPDINCSGRDAFQVALEKIGNRTDMLQNTVSHGSEEGKNFLSVLWGKVASLWPKQ